MRGKEEIKKTIEEGKAVLGIEFGSTRIKAVLIDEDKSPIASGSYDWENQLVDNVWTYSMEKIQNGLQGCYQDLVKDVEAKSCKTGIVDSNNGNLIWDFDFRTLQYLDQFTCNLIIVTDTGCTSI